MYGFIANRAFVTTILSSTENALFWIVDGHSAVPHLVLHSIKVTCAIYLVIYCNFSWIADM